MYIFTTLDIQKLMALKNIFKLIFSVWIKNLLSKEWEKKEWFLFGIIYDSWSIEKVVDLFEILKPILLIQIFEILYSEGSL